MIAVVVYLNNQYNLRIVLFGVYYPPSRRGGLPEQGAYAEVGPLAGRYLLQLFGCL